MYSLFPENMTKLAEPSIDVQQYKYEYEITHYFHYNLHFI